MITSQIFRGLSALEPPPPKIGGKEAPEGSKLAFFQCLFSLFIHLFIKYVGSYFPILLVRYVMNVRYFKVGMYYK